ncbi:hypothetical protein BDN70DRAFT_892009 [Pholiota conissans]|uniref:Uncharacterized protein n=1 Tax=Pholiota conissans TaxID=109636 RepID=A0A9P6D505_9AGAR|nr:hypothetical protein BDN70DRAFT_892009 [Pholiota conissans]
MSASSSRRRRCMTNQELHIQRKGGVNWIWHRKKRHGHFHTWRIRPPSLQDKRGSVWSAIESINCFSKRNLRGFEFRGNWPTDTFVSELLEYLARVLSFRFINTLGRLSSTTQAAAQTQEDQAHTPSGADASVCRSRGCKDVTLPGGAPWLSTTHEHPQSRDLEDASGYSVRYSHSKATMGYSSPTEYPGYSGPLLPQGRVHGVDIATQWSPENLPRLEEPPRGSVGSAIILNIATGPISVHEDNQYIFNLQTHHPVPAVVPQDQSFKIAPDGFSQVVDIDRSTQALTEYLTPHNDHSSPCTVPMGYYDAPALQQGGLPVSPMPYGLYPSDISFVEPETWKYSDAYNGA